MLAIKLDTEIARSPADVYAYLADLSTMAEWTTIVKSCDLASGAAGEPGSVYRQVLDLGGQDFEGTIELTEARPQRRLVTVARAGPVKFTTTFDVSAAGTATKVRMALDPGVAGAALAPLLKAQGRENLDAMKHALES